MASTVAFDSISKGHELGPWSYTVTRENLIAYAGQSGDGNPIHQDEAFAKQVGLPDVIAHGMHTMAKMGQYVVNWAGDPGAVKRFKTRFTAMVVVPADGGNTVTVTGTVSDTKGGNIAVVDVQAVTADGQTAATGQAEVELA